MSERVPTQDIPVFSPRLDEVIGMMIKGDAPNAGRFCGHCYTPMSKKAEACPYCASSVVEHTPLARVPSEVIALYRRMRKRESLIVNSFAFAGIFLGVLLFMALVAVAIYRMDGSIWMLVFATVVLLVSGRVFGGLLGGWIGDDIGYEFAHKKLVLEWQEFEATRSLSVATESSDVPGPASAAPSAQ